MSPRASGAYPLVLERGAVSTEDQLLRRRREFCETRDGQVLVVEVWVAADDIIGLARTSVSNYVSRWGSAPS